MQTSQADIRQARPRDAAQIVQLQAGIYREGRWFVGSEAPSEDSIRRRLQYRSALAPSGPGEQVALGGIRMVPAGAHR